MLDLSPVLKQGTDNLIQWRKRYSSNEYPEKIVLNIFYRRYTMEVMWNELIKVMNESKSNSVEDALYKFKMLYSSTAVQKVAPNLQTWLNVNPSKLVGGIKYAGFEDLIKRTKLGSKDAREELEFSYLFYMISDEVTLFWAALCSAGHSPMDAITTISGFTMDPFDVIDYTTITECLGQFYTALFLQERYNQLP